MRPTRTVALRADFDGICRDDAGSWRGSKDRSRGVGQRAFPARRAPGSSVSKKPPAEAAAVDAPHEIAPLSFEAALAALEQVVVRLEKGDLSLEDSLVAYEAGVRLVHQARGRLDGMQSRLEQLLADGTTAPLKRQSDANKAAPAASGEAP